MGIVAAVEARHRSALGGSIATKANPILCAFDGAATMSARVLPLFKLLHDGRKNVRAQLCTRAAFLAPLVPLTTGQSSPTSCR